MQSETITTATVKGFRVCWANNGGVYYPRGLHDLMRDDLQGVYRTAKTVREFENICKLLAL